MDKMDSAFTKTAGIFDIPIKKKEKSKYDLESIENKELRKIIKDLLSEISKLKTENKELFMKVDEISESLKK